ncbi:MAG TPA: hypothetical protein GX526_06395 [Thermoanaerobacterales bacterium]|nr:hypothetical protein [Thermoanaerobacterales bacterium]
MDEAYRMRELALGILEPIEEKAKELDFCDVHSMAMGTLIKGHGFQRHNYCQFKDGGLPQGDVTRTGLWNEELGLYAIIETFQDWYPTQDTPNGTVYYVDENFISVELYEVKEPVEDLEFTGKLDAWGKILIKEGRD